ncbi:ATP-binding protein [Flavobacterium sp.]|uniref:ATP-binding protein n=1 Tax=Flavobacterium sp. TaxID=239 RepID=UPI00286E9BEC|nr:ATP-binding protein [Flavobacterium sp.]
MNKNSTDEQKITSLLEESFTVRVNNLTKSVQLAEEALVLSKKINSKPLIAKCLNQLSLYFMVIGDTKLSAKYAKEAIVYFEELNDEQGIANAKYNIAGVHYKTNNYQLGIVYFIDALKIYQKYEDWFNQSRAEKSLGTIYELIGDLSNAKKSYKSAIQSAKKINDLNLESNAYNTLSGILLKKNKVVEAFEMIQLSVKLKTETNDLRGLAFAIYGRGKVYLYKNEFQEAEADFQKAVKMHIETGDSVGLSMAYIKLGDMYLKNGVLDKAVIKANEALEISMKYNVVMIKIKGYHLLYRIFKTDHNSAEALKYFELFLKEKDEVLNSQTLKVIESYDTIVKMNTFERERQLQKEKQELLEKKNKDKIESLRLKQEFLSIMSHEIRTPLNAITTIVSMLDLDDKNMLSSLKFASNNLINIVNDILDFTKLDSNKAKIETNPVNFKEFTDNIATIYNCLATEKGLDFSFKNEIASNTTYLLDETKITQILTNLITNAIKFTDNGRIEVSITKVAEAKYFDTLLFKISDSGEGISRNNLSEIFVSFSQIKPVLTRKQGGTGLGLAIVKKLIELHKSKIEVKSTLGKGSEFYFKLKLKRGKQIETCAVMNFYELNNKTALLAEDTPINALLMKKLLSKWGISTDHVINGKLAVEKANQKKYDFILMDIHMPEMNGFQAAKLIKTNNNLNKNTPIFALTADVTSENNEQNRFLFNDFLWKPLEIEKLYAALGNEINKTILL